MPSLTRRPQRVSTRTSTYDCPAERLVEGWRGPHLTWRGVHAQSAQAEVELLLAEGSHAAGRGGLKWRVHGRESCERGHGFGRLPGGWRSRLLRLTKSANETPSGTVAQQPHERRGCGLREQIRLREVVTPALGSHGELGLCGPRAARRGGLEWRADACESWDRGRGYRTL